jgi:hypothetical protein
MHPLRALPDEAFLTTLPVWSSGALLTTLLDVLVGLRFLSFLALSTINYDIVIFANQDRLSGRVDDYGMGEVLRRATVGTNGTALDWTCIHYATHHTDGDLLTSSFGATNTFWYRTAMTVGTRTRTRWRTVAFIALDYYKVEDTILQASITFARKRYLTTATLLRSFVTLGTLEVCDFDGIRNLCLFQ